MGDFFFLDWCCEHFIKSFEGKGGSNPTEHQFIVNLRGSNAINALSPPADADQFFELIPEDPIPILDIFIELLSC